LILLVTEEHFKAYRRVEDRVHGVVARHATVQSLERYRNPLFPPSEDEIVEPPRPRGAAGIGRMGAGMKGILHEDGAEL
jgi:hypothetical protein